MNAFNFYIDGLWMFCLCCEPEKLMSYLKVMAFGFKQVTINDAHAGLWFNWNQDRNLLEPLSMHPREVHLFGTGHSAISQ